MIRPRLFSPLLAAVAVLLHLTPSTAQVDSAIVRGAVTDSASGEPISTVSVAVEGTAITARTNAAGGFRLEGLSAGAYVLTLRKDGFAARTVEFALQLDQTGELDLGSLTLQAVAARVVTVVGIITDMETGEPIPAATVDYNGQPAAISDTAGVFRIPNAELQASGNRVDAHRIGYEPMAHLFMVPESAAEIDLNIALRPLAVELTELTARVERSALLARNLRGFDNRRQAGFGHFFTYADIQRFRPKYVSDVVRRVPGVLVTAGGAPRGMDPSGRMIGTETTIKFHRGGGSAGPRECEPIIFVDGIRLINTDVDLFATPERIAGIEVYTSATDVPAEYLVMNAQCGVILVWMSEPNLLQSSPFEIGVHVGAHWRPDGLIARRIGGQIAVPIKGIFELGMAFNLISNPPLIGESGSLDSGGQGIVTFRILPFGSRLPFYVGVGASLLQRREQFLEIGGAEEITGHDVVLTGVKFPLGAFRPFAEIHLLDLFLPGETESYLFSGVSLLIQ
jgi:hypothetical protein